jgi:Spy/CpxP family protein refolding chaperone
MKKSRIVVLSALAAGLTLLGTASYVWAASPGALGGGHPLALMFGGKLRDLNITDAQRASARTTLKAHAPTMMPLVRKLVSERRALHDLVRADKPDEAAIRAQSARLATIQAELAVEASRLAVDLRKIATPEQLAKVRDLEKTIRERVDRGLDKASEWLAQP